MVLFGIAWICLGWPAPASCAVQDRKGKIEAGPQGSETEAMAAIEEARGLDTERAGVGKILLASLVGTTIEFYDFYIFGTAAALVFGPMFFPKSAPETQALNAYLTFGLAFLARPLGSFLFGHFGDRVGRKSALVAHDADHGSGDDADRRAARICDRGRCWRPGCSRLLRFLQGVGLGGEWGGAALIATENAPARAARLVRHVPSARAADRFFHRHRPVPGADHRIWRSGLRRLGVARPVPGQRDSGRDRTLCSRLARGDARLQGGDGAQQAGRGPARRGAEGSLAPAHSRLAFDRRLLCAVLHLDRLRAGLRRAIARHGEGDPARDAVRRDRVHGAGDAGLGRARGPRRPASGASGLGDPGRRRRAHDAGPARARAGRRPRLLLARVSARWG